MTVCIAAVCDRYRDDRKIILCTDWQVSTPLGRADTKLKQRSLSTKWICLTAGIESEILSLLKLLKTRFISCSVDETTATTLVGDALLERKKEKINEYLHGQYGIGYDDFLSFGKDKFPPELFRRAFAEISEISLGADLVIAGFAGKFPVLLETDGKAKISVKEDFSVIGEGSYLAMSSLLQREYTDIFNFNRALYCVYEAKKYAERVASVGEYTSIAVLSSDGTQKNVNRETRDVLEERFLEYGPKKVAKDIDIGSNIYSD